MATPSPPPPPKSTWTFGFDDPMRFIGPVGARENEIQTFLAPCTTTNWPPKPKFSNSKVIYRPEKAEAFWPLIVDICEFGGGAF